MTTRTITLTGRPPVKIDEDNWPEIASASDKDYDNQYEFQANCISKWWVKARQHEDGRAIVYAGYDYTSNWQGSRCYAAKRGVMLPTGTTNEQICDAISEICADIAQAEHHEGDADRWPTLAAECIADMPAVEIE